jgi:hypothetical protein
MRNTTQHWLIGQVTDLWITIRISGNLYLVWQNLLNLARTKSPQEMKYSITGSSDI